MFDDNFDSVLQGISQKERHFPSAVFCKDSESAIRFSNFFLWNFYLIWPFDLRYAAVTSQILTAEFFLWSELIPHPKIGLLISGWNYITLFTRFWTLLTSVPWLSSPLRHSPSRPPSSPPTWLLNAFHKPPPSSNLKRYWAAVSSPIVINVYFTFV